MDSSNGAQIQAAGLKWMFELELFLDPERSKVMLNTLKMNILAQSPRIKECEILIYKENRQMLVLLDLSWIGRKFYRKTIFTDVYDVLNQLLPTFKFRVTDDPAIMQMAVDRLKKAFEGGNHEVRNNDSGIVNKSSSNGVDSQPLVVTPVNAGATDGIQSNSEEQSEVKPELRTSGGSSGGSEQS